MYIDSKIRVLSPACWVQCVVPRVLQCQVQHCSTAALQHRATSFITSGIRFLREDKLSRAAAAAAHEWGLIPGTPAPDTAKLIGCLLLMLLWRGCALLAVPQQRVVVVACNAVDI